MFSLVVMVFLGICNLTGCIAHAMPTVLTCKQCDCQTIGSYYGKVSNIICNGTGLQSVMLTDEVMRGAKPNQINVTVMDARQVIVTQEFLDFWNSKPISELGFWRIKQLLFPLSEQRPSKEPHWASFSSRIRIYDSHVDQLPNGIFSERKKGGIQLVRSSAGDFQTSAFRNLLWLQFLHVEDSTIGVLRGSVGGHELLGQRLENDHLILIKNSVVGKIEAGALRIRGKDEGTKVLLENVTIGQIETDGIILSKLDVVINNGNVADLQRDSLVMQDNGSITIANSSLIAQPGALAQLPCTDNRHHIISNDIMVSSKIKKGNESLNISPDSSKNCSVLDSAIQTLEMVLHPSCIKDNLPPSMSDHDCPVIKTLYESTNRNNCKTLYLGIYVLVGVCLVAVIVIVAFVLYLFRRRRTLAGWKSDAMPESTELSCMAAASPVSLPVPPPSYIPTPTTDSTTDRKRDTDYEEPW